MAGREIVLKKLRKSRLMQVQPESALRLGRVRVRVRVRVRAN